MNDAYVWIAFGSFSFALTVSQICSRLCWYRLVKLIDDVPLPDRRKFGWPDIRHTDLGVWFAASGWSSRAFRECYWRVLLRGLPRSHLLASEAYSKAKLMRRCMLFAAAMVAAFAIVVMHAYEFLLIVTFALVSIRWLVGDWKEAAITLEAKSE